MANTVSIFVPASMKCDGAVKVGLRSSIVSVHPRGKKVYISNGGDGTLSVGDMASDKLTATVKVGNAHGVFIH